MSAFLFIIKYYNCFMVFGSFRNHQLFTQCASGVLRAKFYKTKRFWGRISLNMYFNHE